MVYDLTDHTKPERQFSISPYVSPNKTYSVEYNKDAFSDGFVVDVYKNAGIKKMFSWKAGKKSSLSYAFSQDETYFTFIDANQMASIVALDKFKIVQQFEVLHTEFSRLEMLGQNKILIGYSLVGNKESNSNIVALYNLDRPSDYVSLKHDSRLIGAKVLHKLAKFVSSDAKGKLYLWDLKSGTQLATFTQEELIKKINLTKDDAFYIAISSTKAAIFNSENGQMVFEQGCHDYRNDRVTDSRYNTIKDTAIVSCESGSFTEYNVKDGRILMSAKFAEKINAFLLLEKLNTAIIILEGGDVLELPIAHGSVGTKLFKGGGNINFHGPDKNNFAITRGLGSIKIFDPQKLLVNDLDALTELAIEKLPVGRKCFTDQERKSFFLESRNEEKKMLLGCD